jgi:hypothetical protein
MIADVRDAPLHPGLVAPDQRHHLGTIDLGEQMSLAPMQDDTHVRPRRRQRLVPIEQGVNDAERVRGNGHVDVRIVDSAPVRRPDDDHLGVTHLVNRDARRFGQRFWHL